MNEIILRKELNKTSTLIKIKAPLISKKAKAGQFVIIRVDDEGERIPLTIAGHDTKEETITLIFQIVGATTFKLNNLKEGDRILDVLGPLGNASEIPSDEEGVCVVAGGLGVAIALPIIEALYKNNNEIISILGFRSKELVMLKHEIARLSEISKLVTDDGSEGNKGLVTDALNELISEGLVKRIICIGPILMMKAVSQIADRNNIPVTVSMNPIMIDGTGMCGACRVTVDNQVKFACVEGPEFDGTKVNFDELIQRNSFYKETEKERYEHECNLFRKEVE